MLRIILLIPAQKNKYSAINNIFDDLCLALDEKNIEWERVFINNPRVKYDDYAKESKTIEGKDLKKYIKINSQIETIFVTIDDFYITKMLYGKQANENLLIWAHYFYGHRFIFHRYNEIDHFFPVSFFNKLLSKLSELIPIFILRAILRKYVQTLAKSSVVSQSIWTDLLLERVYGIKTKGILPIPVYKEFFPINIQERTSKILLFLGNYDETDLNSLYDAIEAVKGVTQIDGIDFFGTKETGKLFEWHFHIKVEYAGKLSREELSMIYRSHFLTICPIFNGNFEMVPVESIMSGTPVISFIQPFMEVTGQSEMVANILNLSEIKAKVLLWRKLDCKIRGRERNRILDVMDSGKVADQLVTYVSDIIKMKTGLTKR
jgi:hypothetical protein